MKIFIYLVDIPVHQKMVVKSNRSVADPSFSAAEEGEEFDVTLEDLADGLDSMSED